MPSRSGLKACRSGWLCVGLRCPSDGSTIWPVPSAMTTLVGQPTSSRSGSIDGASLVPGTPRAPSPRSQPHDSHLAVARRRRRGSAIASETWMIGSPRTEHRVRSVLRPMGLAAGDGVGASWTAAAIATAGPSDTGPTARPAGEHATATTAVQFSARLELNRLEPRQQTSRRYARRTSLSGGRVPGAIDVERARRTRCSSPAVGRRSSSAVTSRSRSAASSARRAVYSRDFTVPTGISTIAAISVERPCPSRWWRTRIVRCSIGSRRIAAPSRGSARAARTARGRHRHRRERCRHPAEPGSREHDAAAGAQVMASGVDGDPLEPGVESLRDRGARGSAATRRRTSPGRRRGRRPRRRGSRSVRR